MKKTILDNRKGAFKFTTPILYIVFNRLHAVKKTFPEIKKTKPTQLFIAADGPRTKKEKEKTDSVREWILKNIDWKCKVKTLFRDKNLGCKHAVTSAIDWFFENVEQGIIFEDDILPNPSFFNFCQEMLNKYQKNTKIMSIGGRNIHGAFTLNSYLFTLTFHGSGWATWKDRWSKADLELKKYNSLSREKLRKMYPSFIERKMQIKRLNDNCSGRVSGWDTPFGFTQRYYEKFMILPRVNLIKNIGIDTETSTNIKENYFETKRLLFPFGKFEFPLLHPSNIELNKNFMRKRLFDDVKLYLEKKMYIYTIGLWKKLKK